MSRLEGTFVVNNITTSTAVKTLLQIIAAANHRVAIRKIVLTSRGATVSDPAILVEVLRQTTAGTTAGASTPIKRDPAAAETLQTTGNYGATAEPTPSTLLESANIPAAGGSFVLQFARGDEIVIAGGARLGIRVTTGTAQNVDLQVDFEE